MPGPGISIGGAVNTIGDRAYESRFVGGVVRNPVFTALLILSLVVVVLMAVYREPIARAGSRKAARAFVYGLVLVVGVMVVHNYAVRREASETAAQKDLHDVFTSIEASRGIGAGGLVPVPIPAQGSGSGSAQPGVRTGGARPAWEGGGVSRLDESACVAAGEAGRPDNLMAAGGLEISDVELPSLVIGARR